MRILLRTLVLLVFLVSAAAAATVDGLPIIEDPYIGDYTMDLTLIREFEKSKHLVIGVARYDLIASQFRDKLYFGLLDERDASGYIDSELWVPDGTTDGTMFTGILYPTAFANINDDQLFLVSFEESGNKTLWVTNETHSFQLVREFLGPVDIAQDAEVFSDDLNELRVFADKVVFSVGLEPWMSDGTDRGTRPIKDINSQVGISPRGFTEYNGEFFFSDYQEGAGSEMWASDGTSNGTRFVKDVDPSSR